MSASPPPSTVIYYVETSGGVYRSSKWGAWDISFVVVFFVFFFLLVLCLVGDYGYSYNRQYVEKKRIKETVVYDDV